jgi:hypothetical protein
VSELLKATNRHKAATVGRPDAPIDLAIHLAGGREYPDANLANRPSGYSLVTQRDQRSRLDDWLSHTAW